MDAIAPMLAMASEPFDSPAYSFEVKWDGVRTLAAVEQGPSWRLWGRDGADYTPRYPELASLAAVPAGTVLDGELVQISDGRADFGALLRRHQLSSPRKIAWAAGRQPVVYMVFDLLRLGGCSLVAEPFTRRRQRLSQLLADTQPKQFVLSEAVLATGREFFRQVVEQGHEGVMAKRLDSRYVAGKRSAAWRKIKPQLQVACLILGFQGEPAAPHSLLLAAPQEGRLRYVGEVRSGLTENMRRELAPLLSSGRAAAPIVPCPGKARWLRPEFYCLVHAFGWTASGLLRYPSVRRILGQRLPAT